MTERRSPDLLLRILLHWTAVTTIVFWLPLVRGSFDGPSYRWQLFGLAGRGLGGDIWFPLLGTAFALWMLYLGWRGGRRPVHALLVSWHTLLAAGMIWVVASTPEPLVFQGDTLGVRIPLDVVGPVIFAGFAVAALVWAIRDRRRGGESPPIPWSRADLRTAGLYASLLPVQFLLLRLGPPDGISDQVGVVLTLAQWLTIGVALKSRS